jgi:hypothetical protein
MPAYGMIIRMRYARKPVTQAPHVQAIERIQIILVASQIVLHLALREG